MFRRLVLAIITRLSYHACTYTFILIVLVVKKMTRCPFLRQLFKLALDSNGFGNYCRCETHNEEQHLSATKRETRSDGLPFL